MVLEVSSSDTGRACLAIAKDFFFFDPIFVACLFPEDMLWCFLLVLSAMNYFL